MAARTAPDPPKRPATAYMMFTADHRSEAKKNNPDLSFGELGKHLGRKWGQLPEPQKEAYKMRAAKAMEKYKAEWQAWKDKYPKASQELNDEKKRKRQEKAEKKKKKLKRQKKDPNAPKRAMSAFMFYSRENRQAIQEANTGVTFGEIGRILGEQWKKLNEEDRLKFQKMAAEDSKRYHKEMERYKNAQKAPEPSSSESDEVSESETDSE
eukprot:CAMPEP_0119130966 /NCGR_PEP_ID=MMETSP1310-20130426/9104_1 /TAXON_ID=464262 /ORGANISM="Genus nov. species nov., Strain RCC2339" /LENGTH=209 /DNA_ID=CAMNT_0007121513 /DNA_START=212 /DNA_END=841 /DNA_ORIENTATION=-